MADSLGRTDEAFRLLEQGVAERSPVALTLRSDPMLEAPRRDPRFAALSARVPVTRGGPIADSREGGSRAVVCLSEDPGPFRLDDAHEALLSGAWLAGTTCLAPEPQQASGATARP